MLAGPLSGFTIAITADRRAEEQSELISRRGGEVVLGPVIRTLPLGSEPELARATQSMIAEPPDLVVLSTGLGVRGWCSSAESLGWMDDLRDALSRTRVIARGQKATAAASSFDIAVDWSAPGATYAEVLEELRLSANSHPGATPLRVALLRDGEPGSSLAAAMCALGLDVLTVPIYEWRLPSDVTPAHRVVAAVAERTLDALTFTSAHAVSNFESIAAALDQRDEVLEALDSDAVTAVCVGPVTASKLRSLGVRSCIEPQSARLGTMVQSLCQEFARRRVVVSLGGDAMCLQGRLVAVGGMEPVRLTERERGVLSALLERPGVVCSKQALLEQVWRDESDDHVVEVTVGRLRRRLGRAGESIETVMRRGYRLAVD